MSVGVLRGAFKLVVDCKRNRKVNQFVCFVLRVGARGGGDISRVECYKNRGVVRG